jgi:hypothetical protein
MDKSTYAVDIAPRNRMKMVKTGRRTLNNMKKMASAIYITDHLHTFPDFFTVMKKTYTAPNSDMTSSNPVRNTP